MSSNSRLAKAQQEGKKSAKPARIGPGNIIVQTLQTSAEVDLPSSIKSVNGMVHQGAANAQANQVPGPEIGAEIAPALLRTEGGNGDEIPDRSKRASGQSSASKTSGHSDSPYTDKLQRRVQRSIASGKNCVSAASDPLTLSLELDIDNRHAEKTMSQLEPHISLLQGSGIWIDEVDWRAPVSRAHDAIAAQEKARLERTNMLRHGSEGMIAGMTGRAAQMGGSSENPSHVLPVTQSYRELYPGQQNTASFRQGGFDYNETPKHVALCPEAPSQEKVHNAKIKHGYSEFDPDAESDTIIMKKEEPLLPQNQRKQKSGLQNVQRATNTNDTEMSPQRGKKAEDSARNDLKTAKSSEANAPKSMKKGSEKKRQESDKPKR